MTAVGKYVSFSELTRHETQDRDFRIVRFDRAGSAAVILAPHGGAIEAGTSEIAAMIAGPDHSLFCFEGLKSGSRSRDLHITSHRFDHPDCLALTARHPVVLSIHGCRGHRQIFVGGRDDKLSERLSSRLELAGFDVLAEGHRYPGRHPQNVCNRGSTGRGAQLEFTFDLRAFTHRPAIAQAVRAAIADVLAAETGPDASNSRNRVFGR
jgi:phage replication-related protein YjqB (UPF0714/DUF867 family)